MKTKNVELDFLWLTVALLVGVYVFLFGLVKKINERYYVLRLGNKRNALPPGDMGWPFIGNTFSFRRAFRSQDPDSFINNLVDRMVLTDEERFIPGYPSSMVKLLGNALSNSEHKRWRRLISSPISGHEPLSKCIGYIEDIVISSLQEWANKSSPIEILNELKNISFNVITKIFMSSSDSLSDSMIEYYTDMFKGWAAIDINVPSFAFHTALRAKQMLLKIIQAHLDERRDRKIDKPNSRKDMIDLLLEIKDGDGEKLEDEHMVILLLRLLLAGHETTAHAAMWLTIYLHDHPEMLHKAKEEQVEIIKTRPSSQKGLTLNEIRQMEYLSKAIDETLRRGGLTLSIFRKAKFDIEINGYIIPNGWKVLVWNRAVHMNSETYPNPKEFLPSRWDNHTPRPGSFIPCGAGSRYCPGADLAKFEMFTFLHHFLLNYRFERINPRSPIRYLPLPSPMDNCLAKITKLS